MPDSDAKSARLTRLRGLSSQQGLESPPIGAAAPRLLPRTPVTVQGLVAKPEHNGKTG
eukprot:COSAG01_NODE_70554_length_258_cov_0.654088_1_plen_57_part_01